MFETCSRTSTMNKTQLWQNLYYFYQHEPAITKNMKPILAYAIWPPSFMIFWWVSSELTQRLKTKYGVVNMGLSILDVISDEKLTRLNRKYFILAVAKSTTRSSRWNRLDWLFLSLTAWLSLKITIFLLNLSLSRSI